MARTTRTVTLRPFDVNCKGLWDKVITIIFTFIYAIKAAHNAYIQKIKHNTKLKTTHLLRWNSIWIQTRRMAIANWTCVSGVAYAPGTIAVNVTWIEREFNACQTHRSMYTSIFNRLRAITRYWSEIATFSYPLAFNAPVRSGPWDNRGKCHTVVKRIQCL